MFGTFRAWLRRLRAARPTPKPYAPRRPYRLELERFEERFSPDDLLGMLQAPLVGTGLGLLLGRLYPGGGAGAGRALLGVAGARPDPGAGPHGGAWLSLGAQGTTSVPVAVVPPRPADARGADGAKSPASRPPAPSGWGGSLDWPDEPFADLLGSPPGKAAGPGAGPSGLSAGAGSDGGLGAGGGISSGGGSPAPAPGAAPATAAPPGANTGLPSDQAALEALAAGAPRFPTAPAANPAADGEDGDAAVSAAAGPAGRTRPPSRPRLARDYGRIPLSFEKNLGQAAAAVQYLARGRGYDIFLTPTESVLTLDKPLRPAGAPLTAPLTARAVLRLQLVGSSPAARAEGLRELPGRTNYFLGRDPRQWRTGVPNYAKVAYRNVYPGIDLYYYGTTGRQLEYDFVVAPRANPGAIQLRVQGALTLRLDAQGNLIATTAGGDVVHRAPLLYQLSGRTRQAVTGRYVLQGTDRVGLQVGTYDASRQLYIDPVLDYGSYLGGQGDDEGLGIAVDPQGNAYVTGWTTSPTFAPSGTPTLQGNADAFVSKLGADGTTLLYTTYLGGSGSGFPPAEEEAGRAVAADVFGNAYVTGFTREANFPTTDGAFQRDLRGLSDAFVAKLGPTGDLVFSTLLGGDAGEEGTGVAVDPSGNVYVTGKTDSYDDPATSPVDEGFPKTPSAYQAARGGGAVGAADAFVTKLDATGTGPLLYSTYLGGAGEDAGTGVAVDDAGVAYVTGFASYDLTTPFPTTPNAFQQSHQGGHDAFVAVIDTTKSGIPSLPYSTFLGGSLDDEGQAVAVNGSHNVYVTGWTAVNSSGFPVGPPGAPLAQTGFGGGEKDAFVARLDPAASGAVSRVYVTYLGGDGDDIGNGIAVGPDDTAWVTGQTSSASGFPLADAIQDSLATPPDAFITRVKEDGSAWLFSTYLGGSGLDSGQAIALDAAGSAYVTGVTASPPGGPFQGSFGGGTTDAFVAKVSPFLPPPRFTSIDDDTPLASEPDGVTYDRTLTFHGTAPPRSLVTVTWSGGDEASSPAQANPVTGEWSADFPATLPEGVHAFTAVASLDGQTSAPSAPFRVTVDNTPPDVTLLLPPSPVYSRAPQVRVLAGDLYGMPDGATAYLDVDRNNDGSFAGDELGYAVATLVGGQAAFAVRPSGSQLPLTLGSWRVRARALDLAGNEGMTATLTLDIVAVPGPVKGKVTEVQQPNSLALVSDSLAHTGNVHITHGLDLDRSPGTCQCGMAHLVYNSGTVSVRPIVQAQIQTDNQQPLPPEVFVRLFWNDAPQTPQPIHFPTTTLSQGDVMTVAAQVAAPVATGRHRWRLEVDVPGYAGGTQTQSGVAYVVALDDSPFGAGWSFSPTDQLVPVAADGFGNPAGLLRVFGTGFGLFYQDMGGGAFRVPPEFKAKDFGTLTGNPLSGYTYTSVEGDRRLFDGAGRQTHKVSADGLATITFEYGVGGRLDRMTTADGGVTSLTYQGGYLRFIDAPGGRRSTLTHDTPNKNLAQVHEPENVVHAFLYNNPADHRITNEAVAKLGDPPRRSRDWTYGSQGGANSLREGNDGLTDVRPAAVQGADAYVGPGGVPYGTPAVGPPQAKFTDPNGRRTERRLDPQGRPVEERAADGGLWKWVRDDDGLLTGTTDPLGRTTTLQRDPATGKVTREDLPDGTNRRYGYANVSNDPAVPRHRLTTFTDERDNRTTFTYDPLGHLETVRNPLDQLTTYAWDPQQGLLQSVKDANNHQTTFGYDSRRVSQIVEALGTADERTTTVTYDAAGNVLSVTRGTPTGISTLLAHVATTSFTYDGLNRLTRVRENWRVETVGGQPVERFDRETVFDYEAFGQLRSVTDALGRVTSFGYDLAGRQTTLVEAYGTPLARATVTGYDDSGRVAKVTDPLGRVTSFGYDGLDRPALVVEAWGRPEERRRATDYDLFGDVTSSIDPLGRRTDFGYDELHRLTSVTEAAGTPVARATAIRYDEAGNVRSVTNPRGVVTSFMYDPLNRPTELIEADNFAALRRTTTTAYDPAGNVLSVTDPRGNVTSFGYDALDRLTRRIEADNVPALRRTTTFVFDAADNVRRVERPLGQTTSTSYDKLNRPTQLVEAWNTPDERTTTFLYDARDRLLSVTAGQAAVNPHVVTTSFGYDLLDRRTQVIEAYGVTGLARAWATAYDLVGNAVRATDPLGRRAEVSFDALDRPVVLREAVGTPAERASLTAYDPVGNVARATDPLGRVTQFRYDALDRPVERAEAVGTADGRAAAFAYDPADNLLSATTGLAGDPAYNHPSTTLFAYDELDRVKQADEAYGTPERRFATFAYDAKDNLLSVTTGQAAVNPHVVTTSFGYDALDRRDKVIEAYRVNGLQRTATLTFDARDNLLSVLRAQTYDTDALGQPVSNPVLVTTSFGYDTLDRRTKLIEAFGDTDLARTTTTVFDAAGNVLRVERPLNRTTSVSYDELNRPKELVEAWNTPAERQTTFAYDAKGNLLAVKAGQSSAATYAHESTTRFGYDALDRRVETTEAYGVTGLARTTTRVYDANGNAVAMIDPRGFRWGVSYDALDRPVAFTDPLFHTTSREYDAADNLARALDALGKPTTFAYDALGRRVKMQDPGGGTATWVYDAADNAVNFIDQLGHKTTFTFDLLGRRTKTTDARGGATTVAYDAADNVTRLQDAAPAGNTTTFAYDKLDRLTERTDPAGPLVKATFAYDAADRMLSATDRLGRRRAYGYDALDRRTGESWLPAGGGAAVNTVTFAYDAQDNLTGAANRAGAYTFTYDALNRRQDEQQPWGLSLVFTYDPAGHRTKVEDSRNGVTTSAYDPAGRLTRRDFGGPGQQPLRVDLTWTARDQLESLTRYNDLLAQQKAGSSLYHYDDAMRLDNLKHRDAQDAVFWNTTYGYDAAHRLTSEQYNGATTAFGYDETNELTSASGARGEGYGYDLAGNRTQANGVTYGAPAAANRLTTTADGWVYTYDAEGNLTGKTLNGGETWVYGYDHNNQLVSAEKRATPTGPPQLRADYRYDAFGRRLEKSVGAESGGTDVTRFAYDGGDVWADLDASNGLKARYLHGDMADELLARIDVSGATQSRRWYLTDRQGSVRQVRDSGGAVLASAAYDSYGKVLPGGTLPDAERYRYTGREYDAETGLQYSRARYYDAATGRWTSEDPKDFGAGDPNLYRYVGNGPTNYTDPSGLKITLGDVVGVVAPLAGPAVGFAKEAAPAVGAALYQVSAGSLQANAKMVADGLAADARGKREWIKNVREQIGQQAEKKISEDEALHGLGGPSRRADVPRQVLQGLNPDRLGAGFVDFGLSLVQGHFALQEAGGITASRLASGETQKAGEGAAAFTGGYLADSMFVSTPASFERWGTNLKAFLLELTTGQKITDKEVEEYEMGGIGLLRFRVDPRTGKIAQEDNPLAKAYGPADKGFTWFQKGLREGSHKTDPQLAELGSQSAPLIDLLIQAAVFLVTDGASLLGELEGASRFACQAEEAGWGKLVPREAKPGTPKASSRGIHLHHDPLEGVPGEAKLLEKPRMPTPKKGIGKLTGFSEAEAQMIANAEKALQGAGHDTSLLKELIRADMPKGFRGMSLEGGAALGKEAFSSQAMLNHVLEEELIHLQQKAAGLGKEFAPGTARGLEEAVNAARKFPEPK